MRILVAILTIHLMIGVMQRPLQSAVRIAPVESSDHSHSHSFSFQEMMKLFWAGDMAHEHSHEENSDHSHSHRHSVQVSSVAFDFLSTSFHFSIPETERYWMGFQPIGPKDPHSLEILRPPIQA